MRPSVKIKEKNNLAHPRSFYYAKGLKVGFAACFKRHNLSGYAQLGEGLCILLALNHDGFTLSGFLCEFRYDLLNFF